MGNLVWHEYARYISISANAYAVWASFWAFFYRKFFWDFVGGTLRDPGGLQPSANSAIFITLIVKAPILPIITMIIGIFMLCLEYPVPLLKSFAIHRSIILRIVVMFFLGFLSAFFYQGTNVTIWSLVAIACYSRALALGETMEEAKENRGKGGRA